MIFSIWIFNYLQAATGKKRDKNALCVCDTGGQTGAFTSKVRQILRNTSCHDEIDARKSHITLELTERR